ncbi:MAG: GAF domain-containing protein [bacterium]
MYSLESKNLFNILNRHNLLSEESLSNLCRIAVEIINKELNTRTSAIFLFSKDGKLRRRAIAGLENGWLQEECYDIGESIIGKTVRPYSEDSRYGEWRLYEDLEKDWGNNKYFHYYKERFGDIKRAICIPLNGPNRTFGVIRVIDKLDSKNLPVRFEENDALLLTMLSHQIATTISRIRRKAELDAISEVSKLLINRESSLQDIYDIVTNIFVREWTDYSACILRIRDKDVLRLVSLSCDQNVSCKFKDRSDRKIAEGYVGKVFDSGQPVTVKNILQYKSEFRDLNWIEQNGLISFGCFPIRTKKKIIGTLSLFAKFEFEFYPSQLTFIKNLSEQVVTATDIHHLIDTRDKISEFVSDINSNIDRLDNVLQMIVDSGMELTNADFGYIALTSKKNSLLIPQKWTSNLQHNNIPSIDIDGEGLTAEAVRKGKIDQYWKC